MAGFSSAETEMLNVIRVPASLPLPSPPPELPQAVARSTRHVAATAAKLRDLIVAPSRLGPDPPLWRARSPGRGRRREAWCRSR